MNANMPNGLPRNPGLENWGVQTSNTANAERAVPQTVPLGPTDSVLYSSVQFPEMGPRGAQAVSAPDAASAANAASMSASPIDIICTVGKLGWTADPLDGRCYAFCPLPGSVGCCPFNLCFVPALPVGYCDVFSQRVSPGRGNSASSCRYTLGRGTRPVQSNQSMQSFSQFSRSVIQSNRSNQSLVKSGQISR